MPVILPEGLPAAKTLAEENIFVLKPDEPLLWGMRPLEILLVNLMPEKIATETQLARVLAAGPLPVNLTLLRTATREASHTAPEHMEAFYRTLDEVKDRRFDGMLITGAPIEHLEYEQVSYWPEFLELMAFGRKNVRSVIYLCWAAMAALYAHYGIQKRSFPNKLHGVFEHKVTRPLNPLMRGIDEVFYVPQSRWAYVRRKDAEKQPELSILAESDEAGLHILGADNGREVYVFGHMEYDKDTLLKEYRRDSANDPPLPKYYFYEDDPEKGVNFRWRACGQLFFSNWLNFCAYAPSGGER